MSRGKKAKSGVASPPTQDPDAIQTQRNLPLNYVLPVELQEKILLEVVVQKASEVRRHYFKIFNWLASVCRLWRKILEGPFFQRVFFRRLVDKFPWRKYKLPTPVAVVGLQINPSHFRLIAMIADQLFVYYTSTSTVQVYKVKSFSRHLERMRFQWLRTLQISSNVPAYSVLSFRARGNDLYLITGGLFFGMSATSVFRVDPLSGQAKTVVSNARFGNIYLRLDMHVDEELNIFTQTNSGGLNRDKAVDLAACAPRPLPDNQEDRELLLYLEIQRRLSIRDHDGCIVYYNSVKGAIRACVPDRDGGCRIGRLEEHPYPTYSTMKLDEKKGLLFVWREFSGTVHVYSIMRRCFLC